MTRRRPIGWARFTRPAVLLVVALLIASCGNGQRGDRSSADPRETSYPPKIALFGDSLAWEAERYFASLIHVTGETALAYDARGTAICDWLSKMRAVEAEFHPQAVELEFSGNAITPCMKGYVPPSDAYYEKYRVDTSTAIDIFIRGGAHVFLIGGPVSRSEEASDPSWNRLNQQYLDVARSQPERVTYVDGGAAVEGPGHRFVQTLPCLLDEPCTGPVVDGVRSNVVRAPDGAHFCPVEKDAALGIIGPCPVYSSGAYRYAYAMVEALASPRS